MYKLTIKEYAKLHKVSMTTVRRRSVVVEQSVLVDWLQSEVDYLSEQLDKHVSLLAVTTQHNRELGKQLEIPAPAPVMTRIRGQQQRWGLVRSDQA